MAEGEEASEAEEENEDEAEEEVHEDRDDREDRELKALTDRILKSDIIFTNHSVQKIEKPKSRGERT